MIQLRPALLSDLPGLERVERATATMFSPQHLPPELNGPLAIDQVAQGIADELLWVTEESAAGVVGFVLCERPAGTCLHIRQIDVLPQFGRRGIGTRLLLHACAVASQFGLSCITLTTFSHIPWNAPFYAKRGFAITEDLVPYPHLAGALMQEFALGLRQRVAMVRPTQRENHSNSWDGQPRERA